MLQTIQRIAYGVLFAVTAIAIAAIVLRPARVVTLTIAPRPPTATPAPVTVYVTGAVNAPVKMLTLPVGSRVIDAVEASGGFTANADLTQINQAHILNDGEQIFVPSLPVVIKVENAATSPAVSAEDPAIQAEAIIAPSEVRVLNINTATAAELETLPNCGPVLAAAIITYRMENGPFKDFADLDQVKGIGSATVAKWQGLIRFF